MQSGAMVFQGMFKSSYSASLIYISLPEHSLQRSEDIHCMSWLVLFKFGVSFILYQFDCGCRIVFVCFVAN